MIGFQRSDGPEKRIGRWRARLKDVAQKLALLSITAAAGLLVLEYAVRQLFPVYDPSTQVAFYRNADGVPLGPVSTRVRQATPKGDFELMVEFNQHGFRDQKDLRESTPNDLFVLGDSFSFGWGVAEPERYSNVLEGRLRSRVFNIAIPEDLRGYGRLLKYAESRGAKVRGLVIGVCMENDLRDYSAAEPLPPAHKDAGWLARIDRNSRFWFKTHSALFLGLSFNIQSNAVLRGFFERIGLLRNVDQRTGKNQLSEPILRSSRDELVKLVADYDAVVLLIPSRALWSGDNRAVEARVHARFVQLLQEERLKVVDMKPRFEQGGQPLDFYFKTDGHWNASGHAVAAEALAQYFMGRPMARSFPASRPARSTPRAGQ